MCLKYVHMGGQSRAISVPSVRKIMKNQQLVIPIFPCKNSLKDKIGSHPHLIYVFILISLGIKLGLSCAKLSLA